MKNLLFIIGLLLFLPSCQKDGINEGKKRNDSHSLHVQKRLIEGNFLNHKIERENLSEFDELKNVVAEAIARKIAVDKNLSIFLVDAIQNDQFGFWNPNIFGTQISCGIYEHDAVTTKTKSVRSFKVVNSVNVSSDLIPGANKEHHPLKASWDYTVTKSSSQSIQTVAEEDVELGTFEENYCSSNYQQGGIFGYGYSASTGQIYTHLAFYY